MLDELLELSVGQVRELLAYADANLDFEYWMDNCLDEDDINKVKRDEEDDQEDSYFNDEVEEDEDWEEEDEEDDYWEEETTSYPTLTPSEEELAHQIANDIRNKAYNINAIYGLYTNDFVARVKELL